MRAVFFRKEPEIVASEFVVKKVITLSADEYMSFAQNLMERYDFIEENCDLMKEENGVWYCLLVTGEGMDEGILVESEGASYARYAAQVPSVAGILQQMNHQDMRSDIETGQNEIDLSIKM